METRLSRICAAIIEAGWLVALIVTPLFFNTNSSRSFEPDKIHLLRSIALVMLVAWLVELIDGGWRRAAARGDVSVPGLWTRIRTTPLVLPALVLVAAYLISTVFSLVPGISFFGSYVRMQGTFSFLSYVAIFAMVLTHLRTRAQLNRMIHAIILTSLPICMYGFIQHFGLDPLPWAGDVEQRVAANMGNAIFVAAYLIMAFFLTLERLIDSVVAILTEDRGVDFVRAFVYTVLVLVQGLTIVYTQSRGPWLGWAAGIYIFGMLGLRLLGRWGQSNPRAPQWLTRRVRPLYLLLIGLTVVSLAFLSVLNLPQGPLSGLRNVRYVGRLASLLSTTEGTNAVRVLIWEGVVDLMLKPHDPIQYPAGTAGPWWAGGGSGQTAVSDTLNPVRWLVGYGPESMWVAYNRFYPPDLAHYEARNASPDRSHNETFDALIRTGALGLGAQLALFGSVFYFALRWLGLVRSRSRRRLFVSSLAAGGVLGVIILWLVDHNSLRLAGLGLPSGMILGLVVYVTLDLLLPSAAEREDEAAAEGNRPSLSALSPRNQLLLLGILAALVAHFTEIHFGIAIASTLTYFWVLAAAMVVIGMGWLRESEAPDAAALPAAQTVAERPVVAAAASRPAKGKRGVPARGSAPTLQARERRPAAPSAPQLEVPSSWQVFLPYALIGGIITMIIVWDYLPNLNGLKGPLNILWSSFTTRTDRATGQTYSSYWLLFSVVFTWLAGGALALAEVGRSRTWRDEAFGWLPNIAMYAATVLGVFFIYGLWQAGQTDLTVFGPLQRFDHLAGLIVSFDILLLLAGLALAATLTSSECRPRPARWLGKVPALSLSAGVLAAVAAVLIIADVNVQSVQADTYYKQGGGYEEVGQWEGAVVLYDKAAQTEPTEDYYDLFLGRALLVFASSAQPGNATLPADMSKVKTGDLLRLAESSFVSRTREDLIRGAYAVLVAAQRLNPLNTDHTANLARLMRSWAFANASVSDQSSDGQLRQVVVEHPDKVDVSRLDLSLAYYDQTLALSPNNAKNWNEAASVAYIKGDTQRALADLDASLKLDKQFVETYLRQGDILADSGDPQGAAKAYKNAAELRPEDSQLQQVVGVYSGQAGDVQGALDAFKKAIELEMSALNSTEAQLADLDAQVAKIGGYDKAGAAVGQRRKQLQDAITSNHSQLQLAYRNEALVLRDTGRTAEALAAARAALNYATPDEKTQLDQLIAELQK